MRLSPAEVRWLVDRDRAFHLVAVHTDVMAIARTPAENWDAHRHEHFGPGGIRNHSPIAINWDEVTLERVLEEHEAEEA